MIVPAIRFGDDFPLLKTNDGRAIHFYSVWPLLPDETEFKLKHGFDDLMDRLFERGVTDLIDVRRRSAVGRKGWWPFGK
jgi:hypothetical protein